MTCGMVHPVISGMMIASWVGTDDEEEEDVDVQAVSTVETGDDDDDESKSLPNHRCTVVVVVVMVGCFCHFVCMAHLFAVTSLRCSGKRSILDDR